MKEKTSIWKTWNKGLYQYVLVAMTRPLRNQLDYMRSCKHLYITKLSIGEFPTDKANEFNGPFTVQTTYKFNKEFANANEMIEAGKKAVEELVKDLYNISEKKTKDNDTNLLYIRNEVELAYNPMTEELVTYETYYTGKDTSALGV